MNEMQAIFRGLGKRLFALISDYDRRFKGHSPYPANRTIAQSIKAALLMKAVRQVTSQVFQFKGQSINPAPSLAGSQSPGPVTIHFAPVIHLSCSATAKNANLLTTEMKRQFERLMKDYASRMRRVRY